MQTTIDGHPSAATAATMPRPQIEDDDDMGAMWRAHNAERQRKRADNRVQSADLLMEAGISFETRNQGAHLIVSSPAGLIDFWPGTGLWIPRNDSKRRGRGVDRLVAKIMRDTKTAESAPSRRPTATAAAA